MAVFDLHHPWLFTFGILGNIVSIFVYFAPLPTFIRIYRRKSTLEFQSLPYVVALFSAMLWMYYAFLKQNAVLLISINSIGCIIETVYIFVYLLYASKEARVNTAKLVAALNVGLFSMIFLVTLFFMKGSNRVLVLGWTCVAVSVCVFAAPLNIVFQVVRTHSVEFMPFPLSFFLTLSAIMWFAYGLLQRDLCVALPNILGFFLGLLQMLLYGIYRSAKEVAEMEKKLPEHIINMVVMGSPEVHPLDHSQTNSDSDEKKQAVEEESDNHANSVGASSPVLPDEPCRQPIILQIDSPLPIICSA